MVSIQKLATLILPDNFLWVIKSIFCRKYTDYPTIALRHRPRTASFARKK